MDTQTEHYRIEGYRVDDEGLSHTIIYYNVYCEPYEAARIMADVIIRELGDGDGENGGRGSLKNCYGDIIDHFVRYPGLNYVYADCSFFMTRLAK